MTALIGGSSGRVNFKVFEDKFSLITWINQTSLSFSDVSIVYDGYYWNLFY